MKSTIEQPLAEAIGRLAAKERLTDEDIDALRKVAAPYTDARGRVTPPLQEALFAAEGALRRKMDVSATRAFQTLVAEVGAKMTGPIHIPEIRTPYWLAGDSPLRSFRSPGGLPAEAEYVVIGAGLTGAFAARNLLPEVEKGKSVVVLEMGEQPACGASGRNGGNIEMMKESYLHDYRGFVLAQEDFLAARFPDLPADVRACQAERQSRCLLRFFQANVEEMLRTISEDAIDADLSMAGWLRIAETPEEEAGLESEVPFTNETLALPPEDELRVWDRATILRETGIHARYKGRFVPKSGNVHPAKLVNGILTKAIDKGVQLFTGTRVTKLARGDAGAPGVLLETTAGPIRAGKVILATNAYTGDLLPALRAGVAASGRARPMLEPRVSHISNFHHVEDTFQGRTMTRKQGDWYANFPGQDRYEDTSGIRRGTLHVGGGYDTPIPHDEIHHPPYIDLVFHQVRADTVESVPATAGQPPHRSWSGVMAFTVDRAPILSFFHDRWDGEPDTALVLAVAFNGYGGSQCARAGQVAAHMAITGATPEDIPDDVFSLRRFLTDRPLF